MVFGISASACSPFSSSPEDQPSPVSASTVLENSSNTVEADQSPSEPPTEEVGQAVESEELTLEARRADAIEQILVTYTEAINDRRADDAHDLFTDDLRQRVPVDELVDGTSTSFISRLSVAQVSFDGNAASVFASFRSDQAPEFGQEGQTCSIWELQYRLVDIGEDPTVDGDWRIDQATPLGDTPFACPGVADQSEPDEPNSGPSTTDVPPAPGSKPVVHLTLDDGPGPETEGFLDLFERYGIEATFFVSTNRFGGRSATVERIVDEGHAIANHTHSHCNLQDPDRLTPAAICGDRTASREIEQSQQIITEATGVTPTCFRPPYGARSGATDALVESFGLTSWLWDIDTNDWKFNANNANYTDAQAIAELNKAGTLRPSYGSEGVIVLLHDGTASAPRMLRLLEDWLEDKADDYEFKAIGGC